MKRNKSWRHGSGVEHLISNAQSSWLNFCQCKIKTGRQTHQRYNITCNQTCPKSLLQIFPTCTCDVRYRKTVCLSLQEKPTELLAKSDSKGAWREGEELALQAQVLSLSSRHKAVRYTHACNSTTGAVEMGGSLAASHLTLISQLQASERLSLIRERWVWRESSEVKGASFSSRGLKLDSQLPYLAAHNLL